ncbi:glycerophosphoryl diester phosphodiesterase [Elusimicrobium posterum]|uniref:glycerophosphodiester phosphodiesterase n=1 Tax=Elusimicrobium posterum TaxID=3116653 RepID=UPI003C7484CD
MIFIAHRGAPLYEAENTLKSFIFARKSGMRYFETDVHLTKDGVLVVHHDEDLKRTANVNVDIKDSYYKDLIKYNIAAHKNDSAVIPTLDELIDILDADAVLNIELKTDVYEYEGIEKKVLENVYKRKIENRVIISSFNPRTLIRVRELDAKIKIGYLTRKISLEDINKIKPVNLHISHKRLNEDIVKTARGLGLNIWVYTVNTKEDLQRVQKLGADAVFTDDPFLSSQPVLN